MSTRDAIPNGGQLTVTNGSSHGNVTATLLATTGCEIPKDQLDHLFEPFFTTKPTGPGLGLYVVKRIVQEHRGEVNVSSQPGVGTHFDLRFTKVAP